MEARVKQDFYLSIVQAHTGRDYVKYEFRPVPDGDAECPHLEYQPVLTVDIEDMTMAELRNMAKEKGIKPGRKKKTDLIRLLKDD